MPQLFMFGLSISRAPLQASTSSSWARSGKPSRTRNRSSFHEPRRVFTLPARHCALNGPNRVSLSPLSVAGFTVKPLSARTRCCAWLFPACPGSWAEPDLDALAVPCGGIEQQSLDVARIGPPAHHIQQPIAAIPIAAELDADGPVRVIELGLLGRGEIPVTNNIEIGRDLVDDGAPFPFEIEPGRRPDLPIATQQPLALEQRHRQQPGEIFRVDTQQSGV